MTDSSGPIGVIAGDGRLPEIVGREIDSRDRPLVVCFLNTPSETLRSLADVARSFAPAEFLDVPAYFNEHDVNELIMVGNVDKTEMYDENRIGEADPVIRDMLDNLDDKGDRTIIEVAADLLESNGLKIIGVDTFLQEYFMPSGHVIGPELTRSESKTLDLLAGIGPCMADREIGQAVAGKRQSVVAVEAVEGTTKMIERAGDLADENCVVLKSARSDQDFRFDVPAFGEKTLRSLARIDASVFASETNKTLWLQQETCKQIARSNDITIHGWTRNES